MGGCLSRKHSFNPDKDLLDLTGKVVVVTGGNTGIGYETVKQLARRGAKVYLGARNESKATGAIAKMKQDGLGKAALDNVFWLEVDYSNPRWAKAAAEDFLSRETRLDILINNAAQLTGPFEKTADGLSQLMVVNFVKESNMEPSKSHFSPVVFTTTLLPLMRKTALEPGSDVRILTLTSVAHRRVRAAAPDIKFRTMGDYNGEFSEDFYPEWSRYSVTKLANILWSRGLQQRLDAQGVPITCISLHPGEVNTFAARTPFPILAGIFMAIFFLPVEAGAHNPCFAAASPEVKRCPEKYQGKYMEPVGMIIDPSENAMRDELADELWTSTEDILIDIGIIKTLGIN